MRIVSYRRIPQRHRRRPYEHKDEEHKNIMFEFNVYLSVII